MTVSLSIQIMHHELRTSAPRQEAPTKDSEPEPRELKRAEIHRDMSLDHKRLELNNIFESESRYLNYWANQIILSVRGSQVKQDAIDFAKDEWAEKLWQGKCDTVLNASTRHKTNFVRLLISRAAYSFLRHANTAKRAPSQGQLLLRADEDRLEPWDEFVAVQEEPDYRGLLARLVAEADLGQAQCDLAKAILEHHTADDFDLMEILGVSRDQVSSSKSRLVKNLRKLAHQRYKSEF